jgi:hypothetical protein
MEIALHDDPTDPFVEVRHDGWICLHADIYCDIDAFLEKTDFLDPKVKLGLLKLWRDSSIHRNFARMSDYVSVTLRT